MSTEFTEKSNIPENFEEKKEHDVLRVSDVLPFEQEKLAALEKGRFLITPPSIGLKEKHRWIAINVINKTEFVLKIKQSWFNTGRFFTSPSDCDCLNHISFSGCNTDGSVLSGVSGAVLFDCIIADRISGNIYYTFPLSIGFSNPRAGLIKSLAKWTNNYRQVHHEMNSNVSFDLSDTIAYKVINDNNNEMILQMKLNVTTVPGSETIITIKEDRITPLLSSNCLANNSNLITSTNIHIESFVEKINLIIKKYQETYPNLYILKIFGSSNKETQDANDFEYIIMTLYLNDNNEIGRIKSYNNGNTWEKMKIYQNTILNINNLKKFTWSTNNMIDLQEAIDLIINKYGEISLKSFNLHGNNNNNDIYYYFNDNKYCINLYKNYNPKLKKENKLMLNNINNIMQLNHPLIQSQLNPDKAMQFINQYWDSNIYFEDKQKSTFKEYLEIPNLSPAFDPKDRYADEARDKLIDWVQKNSNLKNYKLMKFSGKVSSCICLEIKSNDVNCKENVLIYGHFDKQPENIGWTDGKQAYEPMIDNKDPKHPKLYARGALDDGYSIFSAISSIMILQAQNLYYPTCYILIEGGEESGSPDVEYFLQEFEKAFNIQNKINYIIALDSFCGNYDQLWCTTSTRGIINLKITCSLLKNGIHSGNSGLIRDSFHIIRELLNRIDDVSNGEMNELLQVNIPLEHEQYIEDVISILGQNIWHNACPYLNDTILPQVNRIKYEPLPKLKELDHDELRELIIQTTWKSQLCIIGMDDIPSIASAGNVLREKTSILISIRLAPSLDCNLIYQELTHLLTINPPYHCSITVEEQTKNIDSFSSGFVCPKFSDLIKNVLRQSSRAFFDENDCAFCPAGGSLPPMIKLYKQYPDAQFITLGAGGPNSNAHGPNEFLRIDYFKKLTCCVKSKINLLC